MFRRFSALFAGMITAMVVMLMVEGLSLKLYPPPEGFDPKDPEQIKAFMATLPASAYWWIIAGQALGTLIGSIGACFLARQELMRVCGTIGSVMVVLAVFNLTRLSHPAWFGVANIGTILAAAWLAYRIVRNRNFDAPPMRPSA
ncbi:MAG: hypothetical protein H6830_11915 [Planctomycetes bacterium]|nr:hypothetical protein [Planctomycetota bacterium]MCB9908883.1 hypothetical protein [Planctomycetota bacterium]HPF13138.1 hypothetical protein [Planctomycetota bacterium]HRV81654.1 hypothetical protein [Planctomycetota bacterium]